VTFHILNRKVDLELLEDNFSDVRLALRAYGTLSGNSMHVVQPTSVKNLMYLLHEYS